MLEKNTGNLGEIIKNDKQLKMIIYNVTINIHESVHDQWMTWMQEKHIKDVLATGKFTSARMVKVLIEEEMGGVTYSIQYTTENKELLQRYYIEDAPRLREEGAALFGDKMLAFRTELELISEH
jgi:elongation factor P--beta-lysine ligase